MIDKLTPFLAKTSNRGKIEFYRYSDGEYISLVAAKEKFKDVHREELEGLKDSFDDTFNIWVNSLPFYDTIKETEKETYEELIDGKKILYVKSEIKEETRHSFNPGSCQDIIDMFKKIEAAEEESKLRTLWPRLDETVGGGLRKGSTYMYMGLSGIGKSIFLSNIARSVWFGDAFSSGKDVLYITTEMNEVQTSDRIVRSAFKAYNMKQAKEKMMLYVKNKTEIKWAHLDVIKVHPNDTSCDDIQKIISELSYKPELIIIDYFDELKASAASASDYDKHGLVAADLKKLAEVNECPVVSATQTNRGGANANGSGTKETMSQADISDSHKKVRTLDVLLGITQTEDMKDDESGTGTYIIQFVKNRYGANGKKILYNIDYKSMRLDEVSYTSKDEKAPSKKEKVEKEVIWEDQQLNRYYNNLKDLDMQKVKDELNTLRETNRIDVEGIKVIVREIKKYKERN